MGHLPAQRRVLGPDHAQTLASLYHLALVLNRQERYEAAVEVTGELVEAQSRTRGDVHPETLASLIVRAKALALSGRLDEAEAIYRRGLELARSAHGDDHVVTIFLMKGFAWFEHHRGHEAEAAALRKEIDEAQRRK